MTNPTLERAARAACVESFGEDAWSFVSESTRQAFRKQARAVLMAVREPGYTMSERDFNRRLDVILGEDNDQYSA